MHSANLSMLTLAFYVEMAKRHCPLCCREDVISQQHFISLAKCKGENVTQKYLNNSSMESFYISH